MKKVLVLVSLIMALLCVSVLPALADDPGTGNSDFVIQNIDASAVTVSIDYYDQIGSNDVLGGTPFTINGHGSQVFLASTLPVGDGWLGSVVVSADKQVAAASNLTWQSSYGPLDDQVTGGAYSGTYNPGSDLYFPYATVKPVGAIPGKLGRFSIITVQNAGSGDAHIHMYYYNQTSGAVTGPIDDVIGAGKARSYNLSLTGAKIPNLGGNWQGSVFVHSDDQPIAGVVTNHWGGQIFQQWGSVYEGVAEGSQTLYGPSISRVDRTGQAPTNSWVRFSNLVVMNTGSSAANVTIQFFATGATTPAMTINDTIPAKQMGEYNTRYGSPTNASYPASAFASAMGNSFNGSITIQCTNGQNLAAVVHTFWSQTTENAASTYTCVPAGATQVYIPFVPRVMLGGAWMAWAKVAVRNLSGSTANLSLQFYNTDGSAAMSPIAASIAGNSGDGYNTRYGSDSGAVPASAYTALGTSFVGNLAITSSQPIIAVCNLIMRPLESNTYNAYVPQ